MGVTQLDMTSLRWSVSTATRWDTLQGNAEDLGTKIAETGIKTTLEGLPKAVNTARPNSAVVNAVRANQVNAVKASACWVWRPTKLNIPSITLKKHNYVDAQGKSKVIHKKEDQGYVDSGCSRHMTGNMSYLSDFKEFDGGYVTFGGGAKGGKITGKGTLKTVTILNYLKIIWASVDGKSDERILVGILINSKAFRVKTLMICSDAGKKDDEGVCKESGIANQEKFENSTQGVNTVGPSINTEPGMFSLGDNATSTHVDFFGDETKVDMNNITTTYPVPSTLNTRIHKDHSLDYVIGDVQSGVKTRRMTKTTNEQGFISAIYEGKTHEDLHTCLFACFLSSGRAQKGLQVTQKDDGIFISQDKYVDEILKKFGFSTMKTASTPMETSKPLLKDAEAEDVNVYLYRSMIGSLMYLTSSRPDIMFAVISVQDSKSQPKFTIDLEAYSDNDYAGASLDKKSTTRGCQFLGSRLISWQCKKQTIVANSTTEAEYVAAASCCG
ncbi:hypothetical protein Tco_1210893 [Tanacetum coccineum]